MDNLVLVGVIVLFTILDAVARKKKAQARAQLPGQEPHMPTPEESDWKWEPVGEELQEYDGESLFEVDAEEEVQPASPSPSSGQDIIPKGVWEEIAALASGNPLPVPAPTPPAPVVLAERSPVRGPERPEHRAHMAHAKYGTPVSSRLKPMDTPEMHQVKALSDEVRSVRRLLRGGGSSLRQAVILQEILGAPVSLRDD